MANIIACIDGVGKYVNLDELYLISLDYIKTSNIDLKEMSLWLTINIIGENSIYRAKYMQSPMIGAIYDELEKNNGRLSFLKILMDTLKSLLRAEDPDIGKRYEQVRVFYPYLLNFQKYPDMDVLCAALSCIG